MLPFQTPVDVSEPWPISVVASEPLGPYSPSTAALVKSFVFEASERGVPARRLNRVLSVSASMTYAPEYDPALDMARERVVLSVAAPEVDGTRSAASTHRSREIRAIEGYEQGRGVRVSVCPGAGRKFGPLRYSIAAWARSSS